ncbi:MULTISPECIES: hypothetical protein [unclassified Streptomyces]|uniref:hypothetical protein n=1 Tax=unclassified Streptomyces TaxID=2593676 RepID=UPI0035D58438
MTSFAVRRFITRGLLVDLPGKPKGTLHHPGQVAEVCARADLAELVAADTPLGPDQAAARLQVRRVEFDRVVRLQWIRPAEWAEAEFGTSRAGAVQVPLHRAADVDALVDAPPEVDWEELRRVEKGRCSPRCVKGEDGAGTGVGAEQAREAVAPSGRVGRGGGGQDGVVDVVVLDVDAVRASPRLPDEPADRLGSRDTAVPTSLARDRAADGATHGHLVRQGAQLHGSPVDQDQGPGVLRAWRSRLLLQPCSCSVLIPITS